MPNKHLQRTRTFAFILYPDEDKLHKFIFDYYSTRESCVWIVHDKDIWTENEFKFGKCTADEVGTLKKKHTHFLIRFKNPRSVVQFQNDCTFYVSPDEAEHKEPDLKETPVEAPAEQEQENDSQDVTLKSDKRTVHFEVITSYEAMIRYFIHDTIQCVYEHKTKYDVSELQGDRDLIYSALNYEYPLLYDIYGQFLDMILSENLQYYQFCQRICGNYRCDSLEWKTFSQYKWDFRSICESLRWDNYNKLSMTKKRAVIDDIKAEFQTADIN